MSELEPFLRLLATFILMTMIIVVIKAVRRHATREGLTSATLVLFYLMAFGAMVWALMYSGVRV